MSKEAQDGSLTSYFWSGEPRHIHIRSRSVSPAVLQGMLAIPIPPQRLIADWDKEIAGLGLTFGDIEPLPLARTIMRWPDYPRCAEAVSEWIQTLGVSVLLDPTNLSLMACLGTPYHHDGAQYGSAAFCNLFLSDDKEMDLHFPLLGLRIPLSRGTVVIFDTAQPHAVIPRSSEGFKLEDFLHFAPDQDCKQLFLTWELPIENAHIQGALKVDFDIDVSNGLDLHEEQVRMNGVPVTVCPATGRWYPAE